MYAAVLLEPGRLETVEVAEPPAPGPGEALVAVRRVGVCGTDFHAYFGRQNFFKYPRILGHELSVEVLAVGANVDHVSAGDSCAVMPVLSCGICLGCRQGKVNCCESIDVLGVTVDGGMRERFIVPTSTLYSSPGLSLDQLALVETLGIGMHAVQRAEPLATDGALIIGAGPVGLAVAQCLADRVANVVLTDVSAERLAFVERTMKLTTVLSDENTEESIREVNQADLPTLVFDATGNRASMERAFELVGTGGRLVYVGHTTGELTIVNPLFHRREMDVRASRNALPADWTRVLEGMQAGLLDPLPWISHRPTLPSVSHELPYLAANAGGLVKAMVTVGPSDN